MVVQAAPFVSPSARLSARPILVESPRGSEAGAQTCQPPTCSPRRSQHHSSETRTFFYASSRCSEDLALNAPLFPLTLSLSSERNLPQPAKPPKPHTEGTLSFVSDASPLLHCLEILSLPQIPGRDIRPFQSSSFFSLRTPVTSPSLLSPLPFFNRRARFSGGPWQRNEEPGCCTWCVFPTLGQSILTPCGISCSLPRPFSSCERFLALCSGGHFLTILGGGGGGGERSERAGAQLPSEEEEDMEEEEEGNEAESDGHSNSHSQHRLSLGPDIG